MADTPEDILRQEGLLSDSDPTNGPSTESVQDLVEGLITNDEPCKHCGITTHRVCPTCHGPYCDLCTSPLDPIYCKICLPEVGAEVTVSRLSATDGTHPEGRDLKPQGPSFGTLCKRIVDMNDYELDAHIDYYKDLVKQAEKSLDFRRIVLGASQIEQTQRKDTERRRLRGVTFPGPGGQNKTASPAQPGQPRAKQDVVANLGQALGMDKNAMMKVLELLTKKPKTETKQ